MLPNFACGFYLVGLYQEYQECPNYRPCVKFGPTLGFTSFTWACIVKTLEIFLYITMRPIGLPNFACGFNIVSLYQESPKYTLEVKFWPHHGGSQFLHRLTQREILRNFRFPSHEA